MDEVKAISKKEFRYEDSINLKATVGELPLSRFKEDIQPTQFTIDKAGVKKWEKRIQAGEKPSVLVEFSDRHKEPRIIDGHTRLKAYENLGIKNIPVIDNTNKILKTNKSVYISITVWYN